MRGGNPLRCSTRWTPCARASSPSTGVPRRVASHTGSTGTPLEEGRRPIGWPTERALLARAEEEARAQVVVHGDLHFGQLFIGDRGEISGVIDIDALGAADPTEDAAAFLSHAVASAVITSGANRERMRQLADHAAQRWGADPGVRALTLVHLRLSSGQQDGDNPTRTVIPSETEES